MDVEELQLRLQALDLAIRSTTVGQLKDDVVRRAETYLTFLKGENSGS